MDLTPWEAPLREALKLDLGGWDWEAACQAVTDGRLIALAMGSQAVAVLELVTLPAGKYVNVALLGGVSMPHWLKRLDATLKYLAKDQGARGIIFRGRKGWHRVAKGLGYETRQVLMCKDV